MIFEDIKWDVEAIISQALFWELSSWKTHQLGRKVPGFARQTQLIGWRLGGEGWFTLNTGGSFRPSSNLVAAGGIIRDDQGRFVSAFVSNLGSCSVVRAEMKGIVHIYREANYAADFLANSGHDQDLGILIFFVPL
ncbi:Putative ribonuclease H protein At1g65750 [Linum perenne]